MTDRTGRRTPGRKLLLGTIIATLPLAACNLPIYSPHEQAMYSQVIQKKDPALANDFLRKYPDSPLVRTMLVNLPPATLKRLSKDAVRGISPEVRATLPADVLMLLGLPVQGPAPPARVLHTSYDG